MHNIFDITRLTLAFVIGAWIGAGAVERMMQENSAFAQAGKTILSACVGLTGLNPTPIVEIVSAGGTLIIAACAGAFGAAYVWRHSHCTPPNK